MNKTATTLAWFVSVCVRVTIFLKIADFALGASWTTIAPMNTPRVYHTATLLSDGRVLVAGGQDGNLELASCELFDPVVGQWSATANLLNNARYLHTATLLADGRVLVTGGKDISGNPLSTAELFDPATASWTTTGSMNTNRFGHAATLLPTGKVLVTGGRGPGGSVLAIAELFDPSSGTWSLTGTMKTKRCIHTSSLVSNGKVLVAGGNGNVGNSAEFYDIASGTWKSAGAATISARDSHTTTLLPGGQLLVAGGYDGSSLTNAEIFDPASGTWTETSAMTDAHYFHSSTLLLDGTVMVTAGGFDAGLGGSVEIFNPSIGTWAFTSALNEPRFNHTATLMADGEVLVTGGWGSQGSAVLSSVELYDPSLGFTGISRPQIDYINLLFAYGDNLLITGSGFVIRRSAPSGLGQVSPVDPPVVKIRSLDSGQTRFLQVTNWSATSLVTESLTGFPSGMALVTVFANGVSSAGTFVNVSVPVPVVTMLTSPRIVGGSPQFTFTNNPGTIFGVLATTNLSLPLDSWSKLGAATEISPGQFRFTDTQGISKVQRFYVIRAP